MREKLFQTWQLEQVEIVGAVNLKFALRRSRRDLPVLRLGTAIVSLDLQGKTSTPRLRCSRRPGAMQTKHPKAGRLVCQRSEGKDGQPGRSSGFAVVAGRGKEARENRTYAPLQGVYTISRGHAGPRAQSPVPSPGGWRAGMLG